MRRSPHDYNYRERRRVTINIAMEIKLLFFFTGLLSFSAAQCTGNNSIGQVSLSWDVVDSNNVRFTFSAPCTSSQYTIVAFSENIVTSIAELVRNTNTVIISYCVLLDC